MTVRPAEKKWVALLSVLIVAVLGWIPYYLLVVRPRPGAPQQPATDPEAQKMAAAEAQKMAAAPVPAPGAASANLTPAQTNALLELYSDLNPPLPATRDPFKPPVAAALPPELQNSPPTRSAQTNAPAPPPQYTAREPNYPPLPDAFPPGRITVQPVAPPPLPTIELKGVISGEPSIAVVNIEGQTSYRQEGDTLPGNLRIARITEAGIVLRHGRRNIVLEVGHSTEPSRQAAGSPAPEQESSAPPALTPPDTRDISSAQPEKPTVRLSAVPAATAPNGKRAAVRPPTRRSAKRPASPRRVSRPALVQTPSAGAPAPASPHTTPSWKSPSAPILTSHSAPVRRYKRARRPAYERTAYSFTGRRL